MNYASETVIIRLMILQPILGKMVRRPANFDESLVQELMSIAKNEFSDFKTYAGTTMCTSDFYEGQGRLDGAFCQFTLQDKIQYLKHLRAQDVMNIEMESVIFGAMCTMAGVKGGIICVTLLDRLIGDQVLLSPTDYEEFQKRPQMLAAKFIKKQLLSNGLWSNFWLQAVSYVLASFGSINSEPFLHIFGFTRWWIFCRIQRQQLSSIDLYFQWSKSGADSKSPNWSKT